jgi:hypothetical protein
MFPVTLSRRNRKSKFLKGKAQGIDETALLRRLTHMTSSGFISPPCRISSYGLYSASTLLTVVKLNVSFWKV